MTNSLPLGYNYRGILAEQTDVTDGVVYKAYTDDTDSTNHKYVLCNATKSWTEGDDNPDSDFEEKTAESISDKLENCSTYFDAILPAELVEDGLLLYLDGDDFLNDPPSATWTDNSGNSNHLTAYNLAYDATSGSDGAGGVVSDGVDDYFNTTSFSDTFAGKTEFTVFFKGKFNDDGAGSWQRIIRINNAFTVGINNYNLTSKIYKYEGSWVEVSDSTEAIVELGVECILAFVFKNNKVYIYKDGVLVYDKEFIVSGFFGSTTCDVLGSDLGSPLQPANATTKNILLYNKGLSGIEILQATKFLQSLN